MYHYKHHTLPTIIFSLVYYKIFPNTRLYVQYLLPQQKAMLWFNHANGVKYRRNDHNTERKGAGNCHGVDALSECFCGIAEHTIIHRLINAVSRHKRNERNGEKNTGRCVMHARTALGIQGKSNGRDEITQNIMMRKKQAAPQIQKPTNHSANGGKNELSPAQLK